MISISQKSNWPSVRSLVLFSLLLGAFSLWVTGHNYLNDSALLRWAKLLTVLDSSDIHIDYIGLMHPHIPIYLLTPFYYLKGLATPAAPYLLSVVSGALLLALWNYHLRLKRYGILIRILLVTLAALNPLFLWAITSGSEKALSLLMYYLFCFAILRTLLHRDTRAIILLAGSLSIYFFIDERAIFLAIAFFPLIPLIAPKRMLDDSTLSVFILIALPIVLAIGSWFYLNWTFHGDARTFLTSPDSTFLGVRLVSGESLWLLNYGGTLLQSTIITLGIAFACFPSILWFTYTVWRSPRLRRGLEVYFLVPVIAVGLATSSFFIAHPAEILFLLTAGTMVGQLFLPRVQRRQKMITAVLLVLSNVVCGSLFYINPSPDMLQWRQAVTGKMLEPSYEAERELGDWLSSQTRTTMIDDRAGYRIIAARGNTHNLLLSFVPEFKMALKHSVPDVEQIVVLNPSHKRAYLDRITLRYPDLYHNGMPGYETVLQRGAWKVYRRIHQTS